MVLKRVPTNISVRKNGGNSGNTKNIHRIRSFDINIDQEVREWEIVS